MARQLSEAAQVAKLIRKDLKQAFPYTTFSVRSENYAGGDSVTADWIDGPTSGEVEALINRYQSGTFDGMTDSYNYRSDRTGPTAKFVFASRKESLAFRQALVDHINRLYGTSAEIGQKWGEVLGDGRLHPSRNGASIDVASMMHQRSSATSLVCPFCKRETFFGDKFCGDCGKNILTGQSNPDA